MDDEALTVRARELAGEISAADANLAAVLTEVEPARVKLPRDIARLLARDAGLLTRRAQALERTRPTHTGPAPQLGQPPPSPN